jgi:hypothetical protein
MLLAAVLHVKEPPPIDAPAAPADPFESLMAAATSADDSTSCLEVLPDGTVNPLPSAAPPPKKMAQSFALVVIKTGQVTLLTPAPPNAPWMTSIGPEVLAPVYASSAIAQNPETTPPAENVTILPASELALPVVPAATK